MSHAEWWRQFSSAWDAAWWSARRQGCRFAVVEMGGLLVPMAVRLVAAHELPVAVTMAPMFMAPEEED